MKKIDFKSLLVGLSSIFFLAIPSQAGYWLVIGSYRQGPGGRPEVSGITSPTVYAIPMKDLRHCRAAGAKITEEIFKPVWQFDNRWSCVFDGLDNF
tara:strand:+ start:42 stop:329 length:288 start_codon:yes stop_codon:yes gene_type:complete